MGVNGLWSVLEPMLHPVSLPELRNLRLAVDLSIWICECVGAFGQQKGKGILLQKRIIFLRIVRMLQWGIRPVFVLEGSKPALKADKLEKRRQYRNSASPNSGGSRPGASGDHKGAYGRLADELKEMFEALNVPYLVSEGEAEAMCAQLNAAGLVDGCITDDSDTFLFGAKVVYKNFTADPLKVDQMKRCSSEEVERRLGLTRERMVALALLSGCDYTPGLKGVGPESVLGFFKEVGPIEDVLDRFKDWKYDQTLERIGAYKFLPKSSHCTKCCHVGSRKVHEKGGCETCKSKESCSERKVPCPCDYHQKVSEYKSRATEISIRAKSLDVNDFPNQEVIDAFLTPEIIVPKENFDWSKPGIEELKKFVRKKFNWSGEETLEHVLSLYTGLDMVRSSCATEPCKSVPVKINKKRQRHFVTVFEVQWRFVDGINDDIEHLVTLEDANLFHECFPEVVCSYDMMVDKKRNRTKGKKRKPEDESQIKINQIFKVRKKLFMTPVKASHSSSQNGEAHSSDGGETSSSKMDTDSSQEALACALPQTPPRKSPRLSPKKRVPYSPSPSHFSQRTTKDHGVKGMLIRKKLHFSRESTPDRAKDTRTPDKPVKKNASLAMRSTSKLSASDRSSTPEREMEVGSTTADSSRTPVNQNTNIFSRKAAWLPTLSPMAHKLKDGEESELQSQQGSASSVANEDSAFREDYNKVKESMTTIDLNDSEAKPTTSIFGSAKTRTPMTSVAKSAKKSGSKSTSKKLKSPGSGQMRINSFVKRRLLRS